MVEKIKNLHQGYILKEPVTYLNNGVMSLYEAHTILTYEQVIILQDSYDEDDEIEVLSDDEVYKVIVTNPIYIQRFLDDIRADTYDVVLNENNIENVETYQNCVDRLKIYLANKPDLLELILIIINRHDYTFRHSLNVGYYSVMMGLKEGLDENYLNRIFLGGMLHDIGKLTVSSDLLDKSTKLTDEEFENIKQHPERGKNIIKNTVANIHQDIIDIIMQHHEKLDGTGYPNKLVGYQISPAAQIVAVADIFDAMVSKRAYHEPIPLEKVFAELDNLADNFKLSRKYVDILKEIILA